MPRKDPRCPDCLDRGYLSIIGRRYGDERKIVPCLCKHGRQFLKLIRENSPPTKAEPSPVDAEASTNNNVAKEV